MRKHLSGIVAFAIAVALFFGVYVQGMNRNGMVQAKRSLERAYAAYERTGALPASHGVLSIYTNAVIVDGATQYCAIAMDWGFQGGPLAISSNRTVFWIHTNLGPMIIDESYRLPFLWRGL